MAQKPNAKAKTKDQTAANAGQGEQASKAASFKRTSGYGRQLGEKQKLKRMYGMRERQFRCFFEEAVRMEGVPGENLLSLLERRLDNVVYRLKMATTCAQARQMIVHGHILVNNKKVTIPSYRVDIEDVISLHQTTLNNAEFLAQVVDKRMSIAIKVPEWLELMKQTRSGKILRYPARTDIQFPVEEHMIVELYSK
ncbi:30S ribosomal protein S4 [Candidatus Babeliales bacterium]|nr:30S ribosomal protein S4 [Candidatus Babeliales bacterium]